MEPTFTTRARRVILAIQPRLFREMLQRAIQHLPMLKVVAEVEDLDQLPSVVEETGAQWVIVSLTRAGHLPDVLDKLITKYPSLYILAIADDGSHAELRRVEVHRERLEGLSLDQLLGVLCMQSAWQLAPLGARADVQHHGVTFN